MSHIRDQIFQTISTLQQMADDPELLSAIQHVGEACIAALRADNKILFAGNGGSAADAQHLAGELVSRFSYDRPGLAAFALTTDTSILTAIGNDYGYEHLFARQVEAVGRKGDVFVGISTSGNSSNILAGLRTARERGLVTIGLTGRSGGQMVDACDLCIRVPAEATPKIQECHIAIGHIICGLIESSLFPLKKS